MRSITALAIALTLFLSAPALAQEWTEFVSREDGFRVDFPGQPTVEETTSVSEYNYTLPARVYSAERGRERYSMTVVDYNGIEEMGEERAVGCPAGAEPCHGSNNTGAGYWKMDIGGAIVYATWKYLQRDVELTHLMWNFMDLVEGQQLQLTNNADQSQTFVHISLPARVYSAERGRERYSNSWPGRWDTSASYIGARAASCVRQRTPRSNGSRRRASASRRRLSPYSGHRDGPAARPTSVQSAGFVVDW